MQIADAAIAPPILDAPAREQARQEDTGDAVESARAIRLRKRHVVQNGVRQRTARGAKHRPRQRRREHPRDRHIERDV